MSILLIGCVSVLKSGTDSTSLVWYLNQTSSVGGAATTALTALPVIQSTPYGSAAYFDGVDDGLLVDENPLWGATEFTVEVFFRPDSNATNNEERFVHIRNRSNDTRRVLLEIRQFTTQVWILDTYIQSESSKLTLNDSSLTHTCGAWHHVALSYANDTMKQYVDGVLQLAGTVVYQSIDSAGRVSIGARQDPRSWFKGGIFMVKFTHRALQPSEFTIPAIVTAADERHIVPVVASLEQNYPNPFNPSTVLSYTLTAREKVKLEIFDLLGRTVAVPEEGVQSAGKHSIRFSGAGVSSGVYFYRLSTPEQTFTRTMIVTK